MRTRLAAAMVAFAAVAALAVALRPDRLDALSRAWMESRCLGIARVLARASEAAVDFDDPVAAAAALSALSGTPGGAYAVLTRPDGSDLARWGAPPPLPAPAGPAEYAGGLLHLTVPVAARGGAGATLRLGFTLEELTERQRQTRALVGGLLLAALALGGALAGSVGLARRMQRRTRELERTQAALEQLRQAQAQLVVADRQLTLGRLAAGVGHEINNPLTFVAGNLAFAREQLALLGEALARGDPAAAARAPETLQSVGGVLAEAEVGTERVQHIVRQLRTFSRGQEDETTRPVLLAEALEAALEMAGHELRHRVRVVSRVAPSPRVLANPVGLVQVLVNLLVNGAQAAPEGGPERNTLEVRIGTDARGFAVAEVEDGGPGIPAELVPRMFEPFFTTKPAGQGTGLGLSISKQIVERAGGTIAVASPPGKGATFTVALPPAPGAAPELPPLARREPPATTPALGTAAPAPPPALPAPPAPAQAAGLPRLLVIDDEPLVARALSRALARHYAVETASSGREALARLAAGERYDHLLCDLMMPGTTGMDVHAELSRIAPEQAARLVFMTGGAFTDGARAFLEVAGRRWVQKPIAMDQLRSLLDAQP